MSPPSTLVRIRHALGRALRETGQALDRVGVRGAQHAVSTRQVDDDPYIFNIPLSRHRTLMPLLRRGQPRIEGVGEGDGDSVFIAPCATLIGSVRVGRGSSVWYGATLRADGCNNGMGKGRREEEWEEDWLSMTREELEELGRSAGGSGGGGAIVIGRGTNIQDGAVMSARVNHTVVGDGVTVGHSAQIHSARVDDYSLIGMGAVLKPNSHVQSQSFVAAGAVVGEGVVVKSGELWVGNPARKARDLTAEQREKLVYQADEYVKVSQRHAGIMSLGGNVSEIVIDDLLLEDVDSDVALGDRREWKETLLEEEELRRRDRNEREEKEPEPVMEQSPAVEKAA